MFYTSDGLCVWKEKSCSKLLETQKAEHNSKNCQKIANLGRLQFSRGHFSAHDFLGTYSSKCRQSRSECMEADCHFLFPVCLVFSLYLFDCQLGICQIVYGIESADRLVPGVRVCWCEVGVQLRIYCVQVLILFKHITLFMAQGNTIELFIYSVTLLNKELQQFEFLCVPLVQRLTMT